ncbi:MAG: metallophosphoesterase [Bacteroidota bacterium]
MPNNTKKWLPVVALIASFFAVMPSSFNQTTHSVVTSLLPSFNDSLSQTSLIGLDGPYLFHKGKSAELIQVTGTSNTYNIETVSIRKSESLELTCRVDNADQDEFTIPILKKIKTPKSTYKQPEKLLAISDIEGNFNAFYSLLVNNGVMDKSYNWTFGKGHLVLIGDFMDRGNNVTPILWLIYKLEQAAAQKGGVVHFILGNHEILNLQGKTDYVDKKYLKLAKKLSGKQDAEAAYSDLMSDDQELVRWMKSKNTMEKIGDILFVHGGISPEMAATNFTIEQVNSIVRRRLQNGPARDPFDKMDEDFLFASHGPLWFRGMASAYRNYYKKCTAEEIDKALKRYKVNHITIGHTIAHEISFDFNGKVIRTDVKHGDQKNSTTSQALLVQGKKFFKVDGLGEKEEILAE